MKNQMRIVAALMIMAAISSNMEMVAVVAGPEDCLDACSTACVQRDTRLMARCDRKCQIKCGPDSEAERETGDLV